jgi:hypothetical protein
MIAHDSELGVISKVINLPLKAAEKLTKFNKSKKHEETQQS